MRGEPRRGAGRHVFDGPETAKRDSLYSLGVAQHFHQVEPAAVRQPKIADEQIEASARRARPGFGDRAGVSDLKPRIAQNAAEHAGGVLVVFDEKNWEAAKAALGKEVYPSVVDVVIPGKPNPHA